MNDLEIQVKVEKLITALKKHKKAHIKDYYIAVENYFIEINHRLNELVASQNDGEFRDDNYVVNVTQPINEEAKYNKYINMLGMSVDETVTIGVDEYENFIEDNWFWATNAKFANSTYSSRS